MRPPAKNNIFSPIPDSSSGEKFETLLESHGIKIERIISTGQATPPGEWYDQPDDEWVLLLSGSAGLLIEGDSEPLTLQSGDYLLLPARCRHRVEWTNSKEPTVWLACHINAEQTRHRDTETRRLHSQG